MLSYRVTEKFNQGDLVQHPKFGVGIVEEVRRGGKILVLFRLGEKVMVHEMAI